MGTKPGTMDTIAGTNMAPRNRLPEAKHFHSVVEWQFPKAHRYWDDCGKLVAAIEHAFPGLVCQGLQAEGFRFEGLSAGITGALFYWDKASISQVARGDAGLTDASATFLQVVRDVLGFAMITRMGHRTWLCFETPRVEDAVKWLDGFHFVNIDDDPHTLGVPEAAGSVLRTKLAVGGRKMRLEVNAGSISVGGKEARGVIVDVDLTLTPPHVMDDPTEFVSWNVDFVRRTIEPLFRRK